MVLDLIEGPKILLFALLLSFCRDHVAGDSNGMETCDDKIVEPISAYSPLIPCDFL